MASTATKTALHLGKRCRVGKGKTVWIIKALSDDHANLTKEGSDGYVNTTAAVDRLVPIED